MNAAVRFDGTSFLADPLDDGSGNGVHTPGADKGPLNGVVRTFDRVGYTIDWNSNDNATTNLVITAQLPVGTHWTADPHFPPFKGCLTKTTPVSSISSDQRTLTCNVGSPREGTNGQIRPIAIVEPANGEPQLVDNNVMTAQISMVSDQQQTPITTQLSTTISAAPAWDWVKHVPEALTGVQSNGVDGMVLIYPLTFEPRLGAKIGTEPVNDAAPIRFYDHAVDLVPGAILADDSMLGGRSHCGGYDGNAAYPYGKSGLGNATNTTAGAQAGTEAITCASIATNTYPTVQVDITGHKTSTQPATNADGSANRAGISAQIAFWLPQAAVGAKAEPSDGVAGNGVGSTTFQNAISGRTDPVPAAADPNAPVPQPIPVAGSSGPILTEPVANNGVRSGYSMNAPYSVSGSSTGAAYMDHRVRFLPSIALSQLATANAATGTKAQFIDTREERYGGIGHDGFSRQAYVQNGFVPRSQNGVLELSLQTHGTYRDAPIHGCMRWENQHLFVKPFGGSLVKNTVTSQAARLFATGAATTASPSPSNWAHVIVGQGTEPMNDPYTVFNVLDGAIPFGNLGIPDNYVVEFAHINGTGADTNPNDDQTMNGTTCDQSDADSRGWVSLSQVATVFPVDGAGLSKDINAVRIRSTAKVPWHNLVGGNDGIGTQMTLAVPIQVGTSLTADPDTTRIRLHASRAWGAWDPLVTNAPPTPACAEAGNQSGDLNLLTGPKTGWCNRPYAAAGEGSDTFSTSPIYKSTMDPNAFAYRYNVNSAVSAHSDMVEIVGARLNLSKTVVSPAGLIADNKDPVQFLLKPSVTGSSQETLTTIRLVDKQPASLRFVSATPAPTGIDASGYPYWDLGDHPGGWVGSDILVNYEVAHTQGDTLINNQATLSADNAEPIDRFAAVFTPPVAARSEVVKSVDSSLGACAAYPDGTAAPAWFAAQCERYPINTPIKWDLNVTNNGNKNLANYNIVDVFPRNADGGTTDTRTPASRTPGRLAFGSAVVTTSSSSTVYYTKDDPATISRDPAVTKTTNTWCTAPTGGTAAFGNPANCPTSADGVTGILVVVNSLPVDDSFNVALTLNPVNAACDDVYTNNFGGRTDGITLSVRSNDETVMVNCTYDLALLKDVSPTFTRGFNWLTPGTSTVDFQMTVINQGDRVQDFDVTDYIDPSFGAFEPLLNSSGTTGGDVALAYTWDATNGTKPVAKVKGVLLPGQKVTIPVRLRVASGWMGTNLFNTAEISRFDNNGNAGDGDSNPSNSNNPVTGPLTDVDSTPDATNQDPVVDGVIDNSGGDEDDHDIASLPYMNLGVTKRFDQSNPATQMPLHPGGTVAFNITLTNKGTMRALNPALTDTVDQRLWEAFDPALNVTGTTGGDKAMPFTWAASGNDGIVTLTGILEPKQSVTIPVVLKIRDTAKLGDLINHVEITGIHGVDGNGNPVNPGDDTDINLVDNKDDAPAQFLDMELTKTVDTKADTTNLPPVAGKTITFQLHIKNAGNVDVKDPAVIDYVNTKMWDAFDIVDNAPGTVTAGGNDLTYAWSASGVNGALNITGTVPAGSEFTVPVTLRVAADADPMVLTNTAEITSEPGVDSKGNPIVDSGGQPIKDWDSTPDAINTDPPAEDDHDTVSVQWYDVGVVKTVSYGAATTQLPIREGGTVTFDLAITNHGNTRAKDVAVADSVDTNMWKPFETSLNASGTTTGDRKLSYSWAVDSTNSNNGVATLAGILEPGETVHVPVTLKVADSASAKDLLNKVEVTGGTPVDPTGKPVVDDKGDALSDTVKENNKDKVTVPRRPVYDLALTKSIDPAINKLPIVAGGKVTYTITVTNQGSVTATDIEVTDYMPPQLRLHDAAWTDNGDGTASRKLGVTLAPGQSAPVLVTFDAPSDLHERVINGAEISKGTPIDGSGKPIIDSVTKKPIKDEDSTPDRNPNNDKADEDDIDYAKFVVDYYDLALEKAPAKGTPASLKPGERFTFDLDVINEGTLPVTGFTVVDVLPDGLTMAANDAHGWKSDGKGGLSLKLDKPLAAGDHFVAKIDCIVTAKTPQYLTNKGEITELRGPDGGPVADFDSETGDLESSATVQVGVPARLSLTGTPIVKPSPGRTSVDTGGKAPNLALTGRQIMVPLGIGAVLVLVGALLVLRRRRPHS